MSQRAQAAYRRHRHSMRQFVKFAIVGASGVVVNLAVAVLLHKLNGGTSQAGRILFGLPGTDYFVRYRHLVWLVSFLVANVWNFQLNRAWTFRSSKHASWWSEFVPFLTVGTVAAGAGLVFITLLTHKNSPVYLPDGFFTESVGLRSREYWAQLITIALTTPINFVVNKLWTFRAVRHPKPGHELPMLAPVVAADLVDEDGRPWSPAGAEPTDPSAAEPGREPGR